MKNEDEKLSARALDVAKVLAEGIKEPGTELDIETEERPYQTEKGETRVRHIVVAIHGNWTRLPRPFTYEDVAFDLARRDFVDDGVLGVSQKLLRPTADVYEIVLRQKMLLKAGSDELFRLSGWQLPFVPVTSHFFTDVLKDSGYDEGIRELLNEDVTNETEVGLCLPSSGCPQEGVVFFPPETRSPLFLTWYRRISGNAMKTDRTVIEKTGIAVLGKSNLSALLTRQHSKIVEKLPPPGYDGTDGDQS